ncbi:leucine-rich repeat domain-containing protein [Clostridium lacusfryxellense]|uniref:leucine-rich repeat domain-containing protein n=1 Tax=Clostridium lacusfryxellense TaxID=205328 RepID=UPI001C0E7F9E|nr:leucine-rich repeat domain-containing protein [Clostridium lacusfryxellense]MBU3112699.1 leucine-rich repeat domain-containing protein [Clostridium lacusfryxellense]
MFEICLSEDARDEMRRKSNEEVYKLHERMDLLMKGLWGGGTRVKKLHAINKKKCIYEARIDKARRMLFSIMPKAENSSSNKALIYIYHLGLEHDKVIRVAKSILGNDYTQELYEVEQCTDENIEKIIEHESKYYSNQYEIYTYLNNSKFYLMNEEDLIRVINKKELTKDEIIDFQLKLSQEQYELMIKPLPMLIAGTAGSGKTTVLIYKFISKPTEQKIYITYSEQLCRDAKELFVRLVRGLDDEENYLKNTKFTTFENFLAKNKEDEIQAIMTQDRFIFEYIKYARGNNLQKKFTPHMVWEEIRAVWKGSGNRYKVKITLNEYVAISSEEAPNFYNCRKEAYNIFLWYENYLKDNYMVDELDMINKYLSVDINTKPYYMVACDEVQDLTALHLIMLFSLAQYKEERLILVGDDHQIVNHSGFRWENVKNTFYNQLHNSKPKLYKLEQNFRSVGNIVRLANSINSLQEDLNELKYSVKSKQGVFDGDMPLICSDIEEKSLMESLYTMGPTQAILVKSILKQQELKEYFESKYKNSPLIFTIEESKGLEFQMVVLWELVCDKLEADKSWEKILRRENSGISINNIYKKFIRYETTLLYVAITRAMKNCIIYEGKKIPQLWKQDDINNKLKIVKEIGEIKLYANSKCDDIEWFNQGKKLLSKKLYRQAIQCFERIVDEKLINEGTLIKKECNALIEIESGNLENAAQIYVDIERIDEAARCYDNAGLYRTAARLYGSKIYGRKDMNIYHFYETKYFDSINDWSKSAVSCVSIKKYNEAAIRYERAGELEKAAEVYEHKLEDYDKAANYYLMAGEMQKAGRCNEKNRLEENLIKFEDFEVEKVVRKGIGNCNQPIYTWDVLGLTSLQIEQKGITSLEGVQALKNLNSIFIQKNNLKDVSPLKDLVNLRQIVILKNNIEDITPIYNLKQLEQLYIFENDIKDISGIDQLQNMKKLGFCDCKITNINELEQLINLKELLIDGNLVKDISVLHNHFELEKLYISNNLITSIRAVGKLKKLKVFHCGGNKIKNFKPLDKLNLEEVDTTST